MTWLELFLSLHCLFIVHLTFSLLNCNHAMILPTLGIISFLSFMPLAQPIFLFNWPILFPLKKLSGKAFIFGGKCVKGLTIWLICSFRSFWSFAWLLCYSYYFGPFRVSLIEIWLKFKVKLTLVKHRSFPHLRIHLLYQDQLFWLTITWSDLICVFTHWFEWQFWLNGSVAWLLHNFG